MTTSVEAWDAWRIASCEETGVHAWRFLPDQGGTLPLACSRCPHTETLHPDGDVIVLPWGLTLPVIDGTCGYCGEDFRRVMTGPERPAYCRKSHADRAKEKQKKQRQKTIQKQKQARQERREARVEAYRIATPRLAAEAAIRAAREAAALPPCPHPEKVAFETAEDAVAKAARDARVYARAYRAYQCVAGHWHITARYARAQFSPAGPPG
jgi:hypothetical protein